MHQPPRLLLASGRAGLLSRLRAALSGFSLHEAADLPTVLARTRASVPDALVLDLDLALGGSTDLLRVLEACGRGEAALPVCAVGGTRPSLEALRAGASEALAEDFDPDELRARVEVLLRRKAAAESLLERAAELERQAVTDALTGLGNRRQFDARLRDEFRRADRYRDPLALLLVDLDHFKTLNDRFGHPVGDEVLREVAGVLGGCVRGIDIVCRYGGEEFALILPNTSLPGASAVARRALLALRSLRLGQLGVDATITGSVGVAVFPAEGVRSEADLLRTADSALYEAKRTGRNRVCTASGDDLFVPVVTPRGFPVHA